MAYRYYFKNPTLPGFEAWAEELEGGEATCGQDACFGALTHGFAIEEEDPSPPRPFYLPSKKMIDPVIEFFQGDARSRM